MRNETITRLGILALVLCIVLNSVSSAPSTPLSVSGFVYELDGYTQVPAGTMFKVKDMNSGYSIMGSTGRGSNTGKYAVTVRGNNGDTLNISASNGYNTASITVPLYGVMHNVNLLLDTSIPNQPPVITSEPVTEAEEDSDYEYLVIASDPDGDNITYSLLAKPDGMLIGEDGLITWMPSNDQVGPNSVTVEASDGIFTATQEFMIEVANVNDAPEIISGPIITATQDILYAYDIEAVDIDGDELEYSLLESPEGMEVNDSGYISWTPTKYQVGLSRVSIEVDDGELTDVQEFTIEVANVNDAPQIISSPSTSAVEDELYTYDVRAVDADGDTINYSLLEKPEGMAIDENGLVSWTPTNDQTGLSHVTIKVSDGILSSVQSFEINVVNVNDAPEIISEPVRVAVAGIRYEYEVEAVDIDSGELTYSLSGVPEGMSINGSGFVSWEPKNKDHGVYEITVEVYDGNTTSRQIYNLTVFKIAKIDVFLDSSINVSEVRIMLDIERIDFEMQTTDKAMIIDEIVQRTNLTEQLVGELAKFHNKGQGSSSGRGSGGGGGKKRLETALRLIKDSESITDMTVISLVNRNLNVKINKLLSKPQGLRQDLKKLVYEYLQIEREFNEDYIENYVKINFKVRKQWFDDNSIPYDSIVLSRYTGEWEDMPTSFVEEKDGYAYYASVTEGFSYFAITVSDKFLKGVRKEAARSEKPLEPAKGPGKITGFTVKMPFVISGIVYDKDGKTQMSNVRFSVKNLDNDEIVEGVTGEANQQGSFSALITGNLGDDIIFAIGERENRLEQQFKLGDSLESMSIRLTDEGFTIVKKHDYTKTAVLLLLLTIPFIFLLVSIKNRKSRKFGLKIKKKLRRGTVSKFF